MSAPDLTLRLNMPYLLGVFLGVNAVRDAVLVVDGPNCVTFKAETIHGKHDWHSTLLDATGNHRIVLTGATRDSLAVARDDQLLRQLEAVAGREDVGAVLVAALTMCGITGIQYDLLVRRVRELGVVDTPILEIACDKLAYDWVDGYAHTLETLARHVVLTSRDRPVHRVAIVGHMMDRTEGDQRGNVTEMRRMLDALGLETVSVWLSGGTYADLEAASEAGTIVSLPHGREAAAVLAERLGARLIETGIPFGLEATQAWLRTIGAAIGCEERTERLIDRELAAIVPRLEWVIPEVFLNRRSAFAGDPNFLPGFLEIARDLGMRCQCAIACAREHHLSPRAADLAHGPVLCQPHEGEWIRSMEASGEVDLLVTNNLGWQSVGERVGPVMEFGFPSYFSHALSERPFLGFRGFLNFVDRMASTLMAARMRAAVPGGADSQLTSAWQRRQHTDDAGADSAEHDPKIMESTR